MFIVLVILKYLIYMTIPELIKFCEIRIDFLYSQKNSFIQLGDLTSVSKIENEISDTQKTIDTLKANLS
jgi:hypothetical protein